MGCPLLPVVMFGDAPREFLPTLKGMNTLAQIALMVMITGQSNLAGSIVADRERGLYRKLASMPIMPITEVLGRIFAAAIFSLFGVFIFLLIGFFYGGTFTIDFITLFGAMFFILLIFIASTGIGLIIASIINGESAATHLGIGISLLIYFIGIGLPYTLLPVPLQIFSRINPLSASFAFTIFLLEGQEVLGYNPFTFFQMTSTIALSLIFFTIGLFFYSKIAWRKR